MHQQIPQTAQTVTQDYPTATKADLNNLVLNFLILEGYESAAQKFAAEANLVPKVPTESIHERVEIRSAIIKGDITKSITLINALNPELLDTDPTLHFMLLRLHLIELIRDHIAKPSPWSLSTLLEFASTHLAPRASASTSCLEDLEETMALLCIPIDAMDAALRKLLDVSMRTKVAERVNEGLLRSQGVISEAKIRGLVRLYMWSLKKDEAMATEG